MAITSFEFPHTELHQVINDTGLPEAGTMQVCCIGEKTSGTATAGVLQSVSSDEDLTTQLGAPSSSNKLALAVKFAMQSSGQIVKYIVIPAAVDSESLASRYERAYDLLERYTDIYSIVPADTTDSVIEALAAKVQVSETNVESKIRRTLWAAIDLDSSDTAADLVTAKTSLSLPAKHRVQVVFADGVQYGSTTVSNIAAAAAAAGMRQREEPWRPLSNLGYAFELSEAHHFSEADYRTIASNGIWVIGKNFRDDVVNRRQLTANAGNNLNLDEESSISNIDNLAISLSQLGVDWVGCSNINPELLTILQDRLAIFLDGKTGNQTNPLVGPQILDYTIEYVRQSTTALDHVEALITIQPPKPFNVFKLTVQVI